MRQTLGTYSFGGVHCCKGLAARDWALVLPILRPLVSMGGDSVLEGSIVVSRSAVIIH